MLSQARNTRSFQKLQEAKEGHSSRSLRRISPADRYWTCNLQNCEFQFLWFQSSGFWSFKIVVIANASTWASSPSCVRKAFVHKQLLGEQSEFSSLGSRMSLQETKAIKILGKSKKSMCRRPLVIFLAVTCPPLIPTEL